MTSPASISARATYHSYAFAGGRAVDIHFGVIDMLPSIAAHQEWGLLLGEEESARGPETIEALQPGAGAIAANLEPAAKAWTKGPDKRIYAVGYYRAAREKALGLTAEDHARVGEIFDGSALVLVVGGAAARVNARLWNAGALARAEGIEIVLPDGGETLGSKPRMGPDAAVVKTPCEPPAAAAGGYPRGGRWRKPLSALGVVVLCGGAFVFIQRGVLQQNAAHTIRGQGNDTEPFGLSVQLAGPLMTIEWNAQSPLIGAADRATISILEAGAQQTLAVSAAELKRGHVVCQSGAGDFRVTMELFGPAGSPPPEVVLVVRGSGGDARR